MLLFITILFSSPSFASHAGGDAPVADYSFYVEFIGVGSEVYFLNESTDGETYFWDFGDGATSEELNPVHAYAEPGLFIVCLTATNDFGTDTYCDTINTYYAPSADFSFSGDPTVSFTDLTTNFPTTWDWFFGDGATSSEENPVHTYTENAVYTVCLSAGNPGGTSYLCKLVAVSSYVPPVALFEFSGDPLVAFTDLSTNSPDEWFWDFDDGDTSILQNPEHVFPDNGIFHVCLTAANGGGSNTYCENIQIFDAIAPPVADFTYLINGLECAFVDISTNDPFAWNWDFGDGNTSTEQNPVHVYDEDGNYTVCLTAINEGGGNTNCKDLFFETSILNAAYGVKIMPNPATDFISIHSGGIQILKIDLFDLTGKRIRSYQPTSLIDVSYLPQGNYFVKLITADGKVWTENLYITGE